MYPIVFTTFIVCFPLLSFCNLLDQSYSLADSLGDTSTDEQYATGVDFFLSITPNSTEALNSSIDCVKDLNYKTVFLYFYDADGFNEQVGDLAKNLLSKSIQVEYVISPLIPSIVSPEKLISKVIDSLEYFDIMPNFIWMNVINSGQDVEANKNYVQGLRQALQRNNIGIGIVAIPELWDFYYGKWTRPSSENDLLWVDLVLDTFDEFVSFGGWYQVSVISPTTVEQCDMKFGNLSYRKQDIDPHFRRSSSTMTYHLMCYVILFLVYML